MLCCRVYDGSTLNDGKIASVETNVGAVYKVKEVILCTGTYLRGKIFIGETSFEGGPDGVFPANKLSRYYINRVVAGYCIGILRGTNLKRNKSPTLLYNSYLGRHALEMP